jgi:hypothetical protein
MRQTAEINPPSAEPCNHAAIVQFLTETGAPVPLWACAHCRMRFFPGSEVAELERKIADLQADAISDCRNMIGRL